MDSNEFYRRFDQIVPGATLSFRRLPLRHLTLDHGRAGYFPQFQNFPTLCRFEVLELDSWQAEGLFEHPSIPGAKMQEYFTTQTPADA